MSTPPERPPGAVVHADPWAELRRHTPARIALGRAGASLPTAEVLGFGLAHAQARDAVQTPLDVPRLLAALAASHWPALALASRAPDRPTYLLRPDLGRQLDPADLPLLTGAARGPCDVALVLADGLSALAVQAHAVPLLDALRGLLDPAWRIAPVCVVRQGRVAIGDDIGAALRARVVAVLIGERPGLSSPDSLGVYVTYAPRVGRSDAERNCISNVRPAGLPLADGARKLAWHLREALRLQLTGVGLKDESDIAALPAVGPPGTALEGERRD